MKSRIVKAFAIAALATTLAACSSTKTTTTDTGSTGTQTGAVMDPFNPIISGFKVSESNGSLIVLIFHVGRSINSNRVFCP